MRKLLWCAAAIVALSVVTVMFLASNPDNAVLAIGQTSLQNYDEMLVLKSDHTYEQLLRRRSDGYTISHGGTWVHSKDDVNSSLIMGQAGTAPSEDYITYRNKLSRAGTADAWQVEGMSLEPGHWLRPPDEKALAMWKQWHAQAHPFRPADATQMLR